MQNPAVIELPKAFLQLSLLLLLIAAALGPLIRLKWSLLVHPCHFVMLSMQDIRCQHSKAKQCTEALE